MRIAINCRSFLQQEYAGIGRYAFNLVKSLSAIDRQNAYVLYARKGVFDFKRRIPLSPAKNFKVKIDWFNAGLNKTLGDVDIYHSPSPDALSIKKAKIVVTLHDLVYKTFPEGHTDDTIRQTDIYLREIVEKADKIICVSQNTRRDLHSFFRVDEKKTAVIYQGVDKDEFFPLREEEIPLAKRHIAKRGIKEPFILFVGTIEPRKNLVKLIHAFARLKEHNAFNGKLVCIGKSGWMSEGVSDLIKSLHLENDIIFLGYVKNRELRYFYNLAEVFAFPSFYEGFGFPIVEAFSCGAAVVTSDTSSCKEISADAALTVNPHSVEALEQALKSILGDERLKSELRKKALKRAGDFSFLKTAEETLRVYEEVKR